MALAACSTDGLVPPAPIDGTVRVGAIEPPAPVGNAAPRQSGYQASPSPAGRVAETADYLDTPNLAAEGGVPQEQAALPAASGGPSLAEGGANMDAWPGAAGLAAEQAAAIAEGEVNQPVVDGIGSDQPVLVAPRAANAAAQPERQRQAPAPVSTPPAAAASGEARQVAMLPRPDDPVASQPPLSPAPQSMPASEVTCRNELRRLGVVFRDIPRIDGGPACGVPYPIKLSGLSGGSIAVNETTLNCQVTLAFAKWVKGELAPSARTRYLSGIRKIQTMGGYSCRKMNSKSSNPWSEHARGNAIDIGRITLRNGKDIDVRQKGFFAFREKGLLKAVRNDSCKYFTTVLGPGSDPSHWNHFHFDLRAHRNGYRHCD